jgi:hypothetical protein
VPYPSRTPDRRSAIEVHPGAHDERGGLVATVEERTSKRTLNQALFREVNERIQEVVTTTDLAFRPTSS